MTTWELLKNSLVKGSHQGTTGRLVDVSKAASAYITIHDRIVDNGLSDAVFNDDTEVTDAIASRLEAELQKYQSGPHMTDTKRFQIGVRKIVQLADFDQGCELYLLPSPTFSWFRTTPVKELGEDFKPYLTVAICVHFLLWSFQAWFNAEDGIIHVGQENK